MKFDMAQEEKSLLLKDLCARLPYGVKIHKALYGATTLNERDIESFRKGFDDILIPYLRPMSSMTEEEFDKYEELEWDGDFENLSIPLLDWLNKKMFDYRGLIEKGLALEAPKGMYK